MTFWCEEVRKGLTAHASLYFCPPSPSFAVVHSPPPPSPSLPSMYSPAPWAFQIHTDTVHKCYSMDSIWCALAYIHSSGLCFVFKGGILIFHLHDVCICCAELSELFNTTLADLNLIYDSSLYIHHSSWCVHLPIHSCTTYFCSGTILIMQDEYILPE